MRGTSDAFKANDVAAADSPLGPFALFGGRYQIASVASDYGTDGVEIEQLGPDGTTWLANSTGKLTADGVANVDLPPGQYRLVLDASVAGLYVSVVRVPVSE